MSGDHQAWTNEDIDYKREDREGRPASPRDSEKHGKQRTPSPAGNRASQSPGRRRNSRSRSPSPHSSQPPTKPNKVITVFGLHTDTTESEIKDTFSRFGQLERCDLIVDRRSGRSKGFSFLYYTDIESATKAKDQGTGLILNGRSLRVDFSRTGKPHDPTPGKYMGRITHNYRDRYDRDYYYSRSRRSRSPRDSYDRYRDDRYSRERYRGSRDYYDDRYSGSYYHDSRYEDRYDDRYRDYDRHRR